MKYYIMIQTELHEKEDKNLDTHVGGFVDLEIMLMEAELSKNAVEHRMKQEWYSRSNNRITGYEVTIYQYSPTAEQLEDEDYDPQLEEADPEYMNMIFKTPYQSSQFLEIAEETRTKNFDMEGQTAHDLRNRRSLWER